MPIKKSDTSKTKRSVAKVTPEVNQTPKEVKATKSHGFDLLRLGESYTSLVLGIVVVVIATMLLLSYVHKNNISNTNYKDQQTLSEHTAAQPTEIAQAKETVTPTVTVTKAPTPTQTPKKLAQVVKSNKLPIVQAKNVHMHKKSYTNSANTYTVQKGDSLWSIAVKEYNSGYDWVKIARANNLSNPGMVFSGNKLIIPTIEQQNNTNVANAKTPSVVSPASTGSNQPISVTNSNSNISGSSYTVVKGDNLWSIAVRAYGDGFDWVKIARANNLSNPRVINSGNVLIIPRG